MTLNRRDLLGLTGGAALAAVLGRGAHARSKPLAVLILGGTGFIGPHFVRVLGDAGHTVTLFNRGKRDPEAKPGVEQLIGDRNGQIDALKGREWDVVIDNSGYTAKQVRATAELLEDHVQHYLFISSVAVYADFKKAGIGEDHPLATTDDPEAELGGDNYGALKVVCEKIVEKTYGKHSTIIRPSYIAGPGDPTDRFTYWPWRVSKGGEMIAPGAPTDPFQYIDVRDLADFVRLCVEKRVSGAYNLCVPDGFVNIGSLLETSRKVTGADTKFVWAPADFLERNEVIGEKATRNNLPIWLPASSDDAGIVRCLNDRARNKGLKVRSLEETVRDTLEWQKTRPAERQTLRAGLTAEMEKDLLAKLRA